MTETLIITLVGSGSATLGALGSVFLQKFFGRKMDAVTIQSQVITDLYKELGRLQEQIQQLQSKEKSAEEKEEQLQKRISLLENDNRKQASEIKELRRKLNEKNIGND
jgi:peptidoglycan hydrolase CwlO-like protein